MKVIEYSQMRPAKMKKWRSKRMQWSVWGTWWSRCSASRLRFWIYISQPNESAVGRRSWERGREMVGWTVDRRSRDHIGWTACHANTPDPRTVCTSRKRCSIYRFEFDSPKCKHWAFHRFVNCVELERKLTYEDEYEKQIVVQFQRVKAFAAFGIWTAQKIVRTSIAQWARMFGQNDS